MLPTWINTKLLWLPALLGMMIMLVFGLRTSSNRLSDFAGYYTAAHILATEDSASQMYNDKVFVDNVRSLSAAESTFVMYVNPPAVSFLMLPLHTLNPVTAKLLWNMFSVLLAIVAFFQICNHLHISLDSLLAPLLFGLLCGSLPFLRNLQRGQIYVFMLVLVFIFLAGYRSRSVWMTAIPLSALLLLKYFGWIFLLLFIAERRWKELSATALSLSVGICITLLVGGSQMYVAHLEYLFEVFKGSDFATTGLPSIQALLGALFIEHTAFNPNPVVSASWLAQVLTVLTLIACLYYTIKHCSEDNRAFAILLLSVVFTPLAADHHYMLIIPPAFLVVTKMLDKQWTWRAAVTMSILLYTLLGWYPSLQITSFSGFAKLLCFPRLYAAIGIWLLLISQQESRSASKVVTYP